MSKQIIKSINDKNIPLNKCRGQGYDGANTMKGTYGGVQKLIKDVEPNAVYVHCAAHNLNLVLNDAVRERKVKRHFDKLCKDERLQDPEGFLTMLFLHRKASKWKMNMKSPIRIERRPMPSSGTYMYRLRSIETGTNSRQLSGVGGVGARGVFVQRLIGDAVSSWDDVGGGEPRARVGACPPAPAHLAMFTCDRDSAFTIPCTPSFRRSAAPVSSPA
ncbi:hypothetical protein EVAR_103322_1 [Eumeta japonica]|uniref:Zinc finger MYM-type protein 1 n=1 Tax=Eumeta variegata TaxID=151549 RepID=A0A4C1Z3U5_EUMVA|nr:hypothetical protein EVAR_103322_1 [Eumeta japonica]